MGKNGYILLFGCNTILPLNIQKGPQAEHDLLTPRFHLLTWLFFCLGGANRYSLFFLLFSYSDQNTSNCRNTRKTNDHPCCFAQA